MIAGMELCSEWHGTLMWKEILTIKNTLASIHAQSIGLTDTNKLQVILMVT